MGDPSDFERFYSDLKETEKRDSVLTSKQQIDRLLRPGSTYLNLNPFEVLQIDPDTDVEAARKKYKKLSLLIHPDKNTDDRERAERAFDVVKKAMQIIEDPDELAKCRETYTEARARLAIIMSEKRRKQKKNGQGDKIPEDEPAAYNKALWVVVTKVFADREKKRKMLEDRANEEKRRIAEEMLAAAEKRKREEEFAKNYEESRDERRGTWRQFMAKKAKKEYEGKSLKGTAFKPPKIKLETSGNLLIWLLWQQLEKVKLEKKRKLVKKKSKKKAKISKKDVSQEKIIIEEVEINFKKAAPLFQPPPSLPPPQAQPPSSILPPPSSISSVSSIKTAIPAAPTVSPSPTPSSSSPVSPTKTAIPAAPTVSTPPTQSSSSPVSSTKTDIPAAPVLGALPAAPLSSPVFYAKTDIPATPTASTSLVPSSPVHVSSTKTDIPITPVVSPDETKQANKNLNKPNETGPEWGPFGKQKIREQEPWVFEGEANYPPNFYTAVKQPSKEPL